MDAVPYCFCKSVVSVLNAPPKAEDFQSPIWESALCIPGHVIRVQVRLTVVYDTVCDCWIYRLISQRFTGQHSDSRQEDLNFDQLKAMNRQWLRISEVRIDYDLWGNFSGQFDESSLEEIREIMLYTVPIVDLASFDLSNADQLPWKKKERILGVLTNVYRNSRFGAIILPSGSNLSGSVVWRKFFLNHLKFKWLKTLRISQVPNALREPVVDFISKMSFREVYLENTALRFDAAFFKRLIERPLEGHHCEFHGIFTIDFEHIKESYKHVVHYDSICWMRNDGVWVRVTFYDDNYDLSVELQDYAY